MARTDIRAWTTASFALISTPRSLKVNRGSKDNTTRTDGWDYVEFHNPTPARLFVALNGRTASSTLIEGFTYDDTARPYFVVAPRDVRGWHTRCTSISAMLTTATAAAIYVTMGRY